MLKMIEQMTGKPITACVFGVAPGDDVEQSDWAALLAAAGTTHV
jgi:hypothetical protein